MDIQETTGRIRQKHELINRIRAEIGRAIIGQTQLIDRLLIGLLTPGTSSSKVCRAWQRRAP